MNILASTARNKKNSFYISYSRTSLVNKSNKSLINCYVIFIFWGTHIPRPCAE